MKPIRQESRSPRDARRWLLALCALQGLTLALTAAKPPAAASAAAPGRALDRGRNEPVLILPDAAAQRNEIIEQLRLLNERAELFLARQGQNP